MKSYFTLSFRIRRISFVLSFKRELLYFRVCGYGLSAEAGPKLFSEREGYTKSLRIPGGYRFTILRPFFGAQVNI